MKKIIPLEAIARWCGAYVAPRRCLVCGTPDGFALCDACLDRLFLSALRRPRPFGRCDTCGRPLISLKGLCTSCKNTDALASVDRAFPLFSYSGYAPSIVAEWKTRGNRSLSWAFARCLSDALVESLGTGPTEGAVVPVPPRPGKIRRRGWDQVDDLARALERGGSVPVTRCLVRDSAHEQKLLGREARAHNLRGSIRVRKGAAVPKRAVVLDDLMTTGATINACAVALREAGCAEVYGVTLFYD